MKTELPRPFLTGFTLRKTDLEDIHDLLIRQMKATGVQPNQLDTTYEVRFKYGATQERDTLQDILNEPNGGNLTIVGVTIRMNHRLNSNITITLQFSNVRGLPNPSVYYNIVGTDAAWVNDTDTKLATKIQGIKTFSLSSAIKQFAPEGNNGVLLLLVLFFTIVPLLVTSFVYSSLAVITITSLLFLILLFIYKSLVYFFPPYNFCWGSYANSYHARRNVGIWILSTVIVALVIGIIVNAISSKFIH